MTDIFNNYNLFIIDLDSPQDVLSSIGQVDIPIIYNDVDDIRVYEDYLSVTVDDDDCSVRGVGKRKANSFSKDQRQTMRNISCQQPKYGKTNYCKKYEN